MPTKLQGLVLKELSLVDNPANGDSVVTIVKRNSGDQAVDAIMKCMDMAEGAKAFSEILASVQQRKRYWEAWEKVYPMMDALSESIRTVIADANLSAEAKQSMLRNNVEQFMAKVIEAIPEAEEELTKFATALAKGEIDYQSGDPNMPTIEELQAQVASLTKSLSEAQVIAKMSDEEKDFMKEMSEDDKKSFMEMTADQRKAKMGVTKAADETLVVAGNTIRKSAVGAEMFAVMKSQQEQIERTNEEIAKAKAEAEMVTLTKRAADEFGNVVGTPAEKAMVLKAMQAMPEAVRTSLEAILKSAQAMTKSAFDRVGSGAGSSAPVPGSASEQLDNLAKAYAKDNSVSYTQAYAEVITKRADLYEQVLNEGK